MAVVKNMMVRAGADFSAITKQASKASSSMRGMQSSVSRSCNAMSKAGAVLKKAFAFTAIIAAAKAVYEFGKECAAAYDEVVQNEVRLATVMRNTMAASNDEIQSILDLADAQEQLGIVDADATVAGAQELATYLETRDALQQLIPVMNDMAAQQYGFNVTSEQTASIATMLGKVMEGQTGALSRYGYYFSEAEEHILKFGNEAQRAATLARVVERSVGGMNQALAQTPTGRMKQLSNTLANIKQQFGQAVRSIGTLFLPLLNKVAQVLAAIANIANKVAQSFVNVFGGRAAGKEWQYIPAGVGGAGIADDYEDTADAVDDLSDSTSNLANNTHQAAKAAKEAKQAFQQMGFDTLNILKEAEEEEENYTDDYSPSSSYTPSAGGSGGSDVGNMIQETDTEVEAGEGIEWLEKFLQKLKDGYEKLKDFWSSLKDMWASAKDWFKGLKEGWDSFIEAIQSGAGKALAAIDLLIGGALIVDWLIKLANAAAIAVGAFEALAGAAGAAGLLGAFSAAAAGASEFAFLVEGVFCAALEAAATAVGETVLILGASGLAGALTAGTGVVAEFAAALTGTFAPALGAAATAAGVLGAAIGIGGSAAGAGLLAAGGGGLIAALGAGSGAVSGFSLGITGTMVPALGAGTAAAGTAAAGAAGLLGPIAAVIAIVAALGVAIYEVVKHWDEIKAAAAKAVEGMKSAWHGASEWFRTNVSEPLIRWGEETWETVKKKGQEAGEKVKETWQTVKGFFQETWNGVKEAAQGAWDAVKERTTEAWTTVQNTWGRASQFFNESVFTPLVNAAKNGVQGVINWFDRMLSKAREAVQGVREAVSKIGEGWSQLKESAMSFGSGLLSSLSTSRLVQTLQNIKIPHLAAGAVIPPNREFTAVLGDQKSGYNIETPERLLREIVREESGNSAIMMLLSDILNAIHEGKEITLDGYRLGKTMQRYQTMSARANG